MKEWEIKKKQFWKNSKIIDELEIGDPKIIELLKENNKILDMEILDELIDLKIEKIKKISKYLYYPQQF